ncbi:unnamed protein product [Polarella glacialis]|uniref:Chlorophyllase n=1 Tax=Polarella glacialis TaxID=89957 RepID=A0A813GH51_POLGL|nr:unnamed protein product [Polarella glacialis]
MWAGHSRFFLLASLLSAFAVLPGEADEHIVLKPPGYSNTSDPQKMLIFIPGGNVPNNHYESTARAIQAAAAEQELMLWVVIPAAFNRLCIIECTSTVTCAPLHSGVESALSLALAQGWVRGADSEDLWLAGHSLGGVCANTLFQAYRSASAARPYAGLILVGSYVDISGNYSLPSYPAPVLTLNAELDGLVRPGKTSVWWQQHMHIQESRGEEFAITNKPVIILPKLNHSDFCPGFDVPDDLPAEVDQVEATGIIAKSVAAFLALQMEATGVTDKLDSFELIRQQIHWTRQFLSPYLQAQSMEHSAADTMTSDEGSSPFCAEAQHLIAGLSDADDARIEVHDGFHADSKNLEHCHPNWTALEDGRLLVNSCSHTDYYPDTGQITAASEIACKMLSSDRVAQQVKAGAARPHVQCSDVNRHAVSLAEKLAAPSTLERFRKKGRGWCFLDDTHTAGNIGPIWIFKDALQLEENATCMSVTSPSLFTELDGQTYPGCHYCKFLSPAFVLDWMMTDSLKPAQIFRLSRSHKLKSETAIPKRAAMQFSLPQLSVGYQ